MVALGEDSSSTFSTYDWDGDFERMDTILQGLQKEVTQVLKTQFHQTVAREATSHAGNDTNASAPMEGAGFDFALPNIAQYCEKGLGEIPKEVLEKCLAPVMQGLGTMDARALLEMRQVQYGARLAPGICVEGIHHNIEPRQVEGTVRYIHITEVPGQYTMGIFVFPPHGRIPLHDHPEMCVMSRILYGDLDRLSLDLVHEEDAKSPSSSSSLLESAWNACRFGVATVPPKGTKRAFRNKVDHLVAPACTALYPYEGNLHEFVAGPHGAAVLDILLPPYDGKEGRDCTFYHIREDDSMAPIDGRKPCWIVPTGQPEDFHCVSGWYGGLGLADDSSSFQQEELEENGEGLLMM